MGTRRCGLFLLPVQIVRFMLILSILSDNFLGVRGEKKMPKKIDDNADLLMPDLPAVRRSNVPRVFRHGTRGETAARCIGAIEKGCEIFGLTKGDFSMIDILLHVVAQIGPCHVGLSTWTAALSEIKQADSLLTDRRLLSLRFLVDRSFPARQPGYYKKLRETFPDAVRMARLHAKFILLENDSFSVAVRTSMNLNANLRIENYEISEGSPISDYLRQVLDYHFALPLEDSYNGFKTFTLEKDIEKPKISQKSPFDLWA